MRLLFCFIRFPELPSNPGACSPRSVHLLSWYWLLPNTTMVLDNRYTYSLQKLESLRQQSLIGSVGLVSPVEQGLEVLLKSWCKPELRRNRIYKVEKASLFLLEKSLPDYKRQGQKPCWQPPSVFYKGKHHLVFSSPSIPYQRPGHSLRLSPCEWVSVPSGHFVSVKQLDLNVAYEKQWTSMCICEPKLSRAQARGQSVSGAKIRSRPCVFCRGTFLSVPAGLLGTLGCTHCQGLLSFLPWSDYKSLSQKPGLQRSPDTVP